MTDVPFTANITNISFTMMDENMMDENITTTGQQFTSCYTL